MKQLEDRKNKKFRNRVSKEDRRYQDGDRKRRMSKLRPKSRDVDDLMPWEEDDNPIDLFGVADESE